MGWGGGNLSGGDGWERGLGSGRNFIKNTNIPHTGKEWEKS